MGKSAASFPGVVLFVSNKCNDRGNTCGYGEKRKAVKKGK